MNGPFSMMLSVLVVIYLIIAQANTMRALREEPLLVRFLVVFLWACSVILVLLFAFLALSYNSPLLEYEEITEPLYRLKN